MESEIALIKPLFDSAEAYGKTSLELLKLKTLDKSVSIASGFASRSMVFFFTAMFVFTLNIALALWIGEILGKVHYGFFCIAAFYAAMACILHFLMHDWMKMYLGNALIEQILD
jgi:hypothetical protein